MFSSLSMCVIVVIALLFCRLSILFSWASIEITEKLSVSMKIFCSGCEYVGCLNFHTVKYA